MSTDAPVPPVSPPPPTPPPPNKKRKWLLYGCGSFLALILLLVATVFVTIWWIQRPIKPVVLSARERAAVEEKLEKMGASTPIRPAPSTTPSTSVPVREPEAVELPAVLPRTDLEQKDRSYVAGGKALKLTEREINGLLNLNTDLGKTVRLEFDTDAVNAYLAVPIPKDFPIGGGKMFRARGRFRVSLGNGGTPYAILEDVTVFGLSLPKAWLGGIKGENLLGDAMGQRKDGPFLKGVKSLRVEPGALVLEVTD